MLNQMTTAQMAQGVAIKQQPAIDEAINAIHDEVIRYQNNLNRLVDKLAAPRPTNGCDESKKCCPATIGEALQDIYNLLCYTNEILAVTNKRIEEQIGDLKLLP